jgi:tRNA(adenine34) deaminase
LDSGSAWALLEPGWQAAFHQAWLACRDGSFPVGAALIGSDGSLIAIDRNRIFGPGEGGLSGSLLAHAEVAALSRLPVDERYDGVTLFTTLEPCLFCIGAVVLSRVGTVRFAGGDSYGGAARLPLDLNAQTARYPLQIHGPLDDPFGRLAAELPLVYLAATDRWTRVLDHVGIHDPQLLETAQGLGRLEPFCDPGSFDLAGACEAAWPTIAE